MEDHPARRGHFRVCRHRGAHRRDRRPVWRKLPRCPTRSERRELQRGRARLRAGSEKRGSPLEEERRDGGRVVLRHKVKGKNMTKQTQLGGTFTLPGTA